MRILRGLLYLVLGLAVLIGILFVAARFKDGPIAMIPGGPLEAGELVNDPVTDWSFAADVPEIELQLSYQPSSRTTWIVVHDGRAFVPVSLSFPPGKRWHLAADQNGSALLRIEGRRYPVQLERVRDEAEASQVFEVLRGKYPPPPGSGGGAWLFEVISR